MRAIFTTFHRFLWLLPLLSVNELQWQSNQVHARLSSGEVNPTQERGLQAVPRLRCSSLSGDGASSNHTLTGSVNIDIVSGLCTLVEITSSGFIKPVARSYNGNDWEAAGSDEFGSVTFSCGSRDCTTKNLPNERRRYQLTSFNAPSYSSEDEIARLLEQATFGPTRSDIQGYRRASLTPSRWVVEQMALPPTSHRATYRQRLNSQFMEPIAVGAPTHPCMAGARYRRYAFTGKERNKFLTIRTSPDNQNRKELILDGAVRTVVDGPIVTQEGFSDGNPRVFADGTYDMCQSADFLGEYFALDHPVYGCSGVVFGQTWNNPIIDFDRTTPVDTVNLGGAARPIDVQYFDVEDRNPLQQIILTRDLSDRLCSSIGPTGNPIRTIFGMYNGAYWVHDPRFNVTENTLENPLVDGGGAVAAANTNTRDSRRSAVCSNVVRNFLNEDSCFLSKVPNVCSYRGDNQNVRRDRHTIMLNETMIRTFNRGRRIYAYGVNGLRIDQDIQAPPPCLPESGSRWLRQSRCGSNSNAPSVTEKTKNFFRTLFDEASARSRDFSKNPTLRDVESPDEIRCSFEDVSKKGFEIRDSSGVCWLNVHPDHLGVYDFTSWTISHPGNIGNRNPIREFAERGSTLLEFPDWHEMSRWQQNKQRFRYLGRMGDEFDYLSLPYAVQTRELDRLVGYVPPPEQVRDPNALGSTVVCGSPYEVSNNFFLGGTQEKGAFDARTAIGISTNNDEFSRQKKIVWTDIALTAKDQLRQRMAWALAQILVVSMEDVTNGHFLTEMFMQYYDIFVRNAFGSYRDILKEVSYSPVMADMLTYYGSRSTAYAWKYDGNLEYADENYAREVMQLFSIGLVKLNMNGTEVYDRSGIPVRVYTNDDIVEYARVWTGFEAQVGRGNYEYAYGRNSVDPMRIIEDFRDWFPKMGLDRQYIGDGYPLCIDLPNRHFLRKGAKYRLLGSSPSPELQDDPTRWDTDPNTKRFVLRPNGSNSLFAKLCGSTNAANCNNAATVILNQNLACSGQECNVDTARVVQVGNVFYEYIRPPCVHQGFFNEARQLSRHRSRQDVFCADRRYESASPCCGGRDRRLDLEYFGERTRHVTADTRCDFSLCTRTSGPSCDQRKPEVGLRCIDNSFYWTAASCRIRAKIDRYGNVGIVHAGKDVGEDSWEYIENEDFDRFVQEDTKTFFRVDWTGDFKSVFDRCDSISTCAKTQDGMCVCDVSVKDEAVFRQRPSRNQILSSLKIGAFNPQFLGGYSSSTNNGVTSHITSGGLGSMNTIFQVEDNNGVTQMRKNMRSVANIVGTNVSFRNPVHFVHLADPEIRDEHYETDAALDHYFYHSNTAPFLAIRLAQRFGISNPSPRYVEAIATAFKSGRYGKDGITFGSNTYGDLEATIACVLLDREARSTVLDSDPSHGSLKEPLIKVLSLMRSMEYQLFETSPFVDFGDYFGGRIGQMAHEIPNVFSFFLPEHQPSGRVAQACLTAPEGQVLTTPKIIALLNGMFALIKYGLGNDCWGGFGGFGPYSYTSGCREKRPGIYENSAGRLTFVPSNVGSAVNVVNELATLLTAGRLSSESRRAIQRLYSSADNPMIGLIRAQQVIATSPEFHATNIVRRTGQSRAEPKRRPPSDRPYKAVVYVLLEGGVDSFNMLVPHTCSRRNENGLTLRDQYNAERTTIAMTDNERSRIIDATGQPCSQFAIHQNLGVVERLYKDGDLAFFANVGVINQPVTRDNYIEKTRTQLFAHNAMQEEAQRIDPFTTSPGTGVLGRMCDVLNADGFNAQPVTIEDASFATVGEPGRAVDPLIVSSGGFVGFSPRPSGETFNLRSYLDDLNKGTKLQSSLYGETWSDRLDKALFDNDLLLNAASRISLTQRRPGSNSYVDKFETVATLMAAHKERGADRDVFFVTLGSWDHHNRLKYNLGKEFATLDSSLTYFTNEVKAQGLWDNMTLVLTSDFGRTLTANSGEGSDHAWGGNYFITGGSVQGGKIYGDFPVDITEAGPLNIGRGRLIPTMSWESILNGVVQWMGVEGGSDLNYCLPNRIQTGTRLFTSRELFQNVPPAPAPAPFGFSACFPGDSTVDVYGKGTIQMKKVKINDLVLSGDGDYSMVYAFAHKLDDIEAEFVQIHTIKNYSNKNNDDTRTAVGGGMIELTRDHMVKIAEGTFVPAESVKIGMMLYLASGERVVANRIGIVKKRSGVYAPFTMSGSIVVNGIVASNYVTLQSNKSTLTIGGIKFMTYQWLMHRYQTVHRGICMLMDCGGEGYDEDDGIAYWAGSPYRVWKWLLGKGEVLQLMLLMPFMIIMSLFWVGEMIFDGWNYMYNKEDPLMAVIVVGCFVLSIVYAIHTMRKFGGRSVGKSMKQHGKCMVS